MKKIVCILLAVTTLMLLITGCSPKIKTQEVSTEIDKIEVEVTDVSIQPSGLDFTLKLKNGSKYLIKQNVVYIGLRIKKGENRYTSNNCKAEAEGNKLDIAPGEEISLSAFIPKENYEDNDMIDITTPFYKIEGYLNEVDNSNRFGIGGSLDVREYSAILADDFYAIIKDKDNYILTIYNPDKKVIYDATFPHKKPHVSKLYNDIVKISVSLGSPNSYVYFFDMKSHAVSEVYRNPKLIDQKKIVFVKEGKLIISDLFDEASFYQEIKRDFSPTAEPSDAIVEVEFMKDKELYIEYLEGKNFTRKREFVQIKDPVGKFR